MRDRTYHRRILKFVRGSHISISCSRRWERDFGLLDEQWHDNRKSKWHGKFWKHWLIETNAKYMQTMFGFIMYLLKKQLFMATMAYKLWNEVHSSNYIMTFRPCFPLNAALCHCLVPCFGSGSIWTSGALTIRHTPLIINICSSLKVIKNHKYCKKSIVNYFFWTKTIYFFKTGISRCF